MLIYILYDSTEKSNYIPKHTKTTIAPLSFELIECYIHVYTCLYMIFQRNSFPYFSIASLDVFIITIKF